MPNQKCPECGKEKQDVIAFRIFKRTPRWEDKIVQNIKKYYLGLAPEKRKMPDFPSTEREQVQANHDNGYNQSTVDYKKKIMEG